jgi:hypothetical protein
MLSGSFLYARKCKEAYTVIKKRTFWLVVLKPYKQIVTFHTFARTVCWCKSRSKGSSTQQYSSPPKGQRTKEPLRRTTPSSTTATTKQKLEKTTIAYYFVVLHHLMFVPSVTMALLYIGMGIDGNCPQVLSGYFLPSPWWTRYLQEAP